MLAVTDVSHGKHGSGYAGLGQDCCSYSRGSLALLGRASQSVYCCKYCNVRFHRYRILYDYPCDEFTEVYWVRYRGIDSARAAKRRMDSRPFFSNLLHICYAPEFEDIKETKEKLEQRRVTVMKKLRISKFNWCMGGMRVYCAI